MKGITLRCIAALIIACCMSVSQALALTASNTVKPTANTDSITTAEKVDSILINGIKKANMKNYKQAINNFNTALRILEARQYRNSQYMVTLQNIANMYDNLQQPDSAMTYMERAILSYEKNNGNIFKSKDEDMLTVISNYGIICYKSGNAKKAEKCLRHTINNAPPTTNAWKLATSSLAGILSELGRYSESIDLLKPLDKMSNGRLSSVKQSLTVNYAFMNDSTNAVRSLEEYNKLLKETIINIFTKFDKSERENYWTFVSRHINYLTNWLAGKLPSDKTAAMAYDNLLFTKTLMLEADRIETSMKTDSTNNKNNAEDIKKALETYAGTWQHVSGMLKDNEVAIEFGYIPVMDKYPNETAHYGAFIVGKGYKAPKFVLLAEIDSIDNRFQSDNSDELIVNETYKPANMQWIYNHLWKDIEPLIKGKTTVYYTPARNLANLNFDIITSPAGQLLSQRYHMKRLSSTNLIAMSQANTAKSPVTAVLYGHIDYGDISNNPRLSKHEKETRGLWGELPATKAETDTIAYMLRRHNVATTVYQGSRATEESVKQLDGKAPSLLHFATHAFIIDTPDKADNLKLNTRPANFDLKDDYLTVAGLLLAGANDAWNGNTPTDNHKEDGVLTGDEIARLNLKGTHMVVLSACETAKGKIDVIDGVFGLQRAFKRAGAATIVMSLWKVSDSVTTMLMTQFYKNLLRGSESHEALLKAMMHVRRTYPDPYYWAGFIMLD